MAMLERRGIVKKTGEDEDSVAADSGAQRPNPEADLRTLLIPPTDDSAYVTPAARQPIPGMMSPSLPGERSSQSDRDPREHEQRSTPAPVGYAVPVAPNPRIDLEPSDDWLGSDQDATGYNPGVFEEQPEYSPQLTDDLKPVNPFREDPSPMPEPFSIAIGPTTEAPVQELPPEPSQVYAPEPPQVYAPEPPTVDSYTDRYLDITELYNVLSLETNRKDTVYLIEEYLKTLPESLPDESRRDIIERIVAASGFDYDLLMGDGVLRVKMLKDYAGRFAQYTDDYVAARNAELNELEQQSMRIRRLIENRRDLHKKQFFAIEAEAQRLKDILTFISG